MYDLAIIGGMGPAATAELFNRIVAYTPASCDQEHLRVLVLNDPTIPDRTAYLCEGGPSPLPQIMGHVAEAKQLGCAHYVIPCNTSHCFAEEFAAVEGIGFINMVEKTCLVAAERAKGVSAKQICVLATLGTYAADVYKKHSQNITSINFVYPSAALQQELMAAIRTIKAGDYEPCALAAELEQKFAQEFSMSETIFILACTELSLLLPQLKATYLDSLEVLARCCVSEGKNDDKE